MGRRGEIHQHSGWLIPMGLLGVIAALCGFFLLYYLRPPPAPFRNSQPTASATAVNFSLRGQMFRVPARYVESRAGDGRDQISLFAALPDMRGYSNAEDALFAGNAPDSPVIHLLIRADASNLDAHTRLKRVYAPYLLEPEGEPAPFGLTRYDFRPDSAYARSELFAGKGGGVLFLCERPAQDLPSPNCLAIGKTIAPGVSLAYRFKRAHLARWQTIEDDAGRLISRFRR
ncbi:MAG TPA: hypothetical protein VGM26_04925 [Rhizomicrobium sp.]